MSRGTSDGCGRLCRRRGLLGGDGVGRVVRAGPPARTAVHGLKSSTPSRRAPVQPIMVVVRHRFIFSRGTLEDALCCQSTSAATVDSLPCVSSRRKWRSGYERPCDPCHTCDCCINSFVLRVGGLVANTRKSHRSVGMGPRPGTKHCTINPLLSRQLCQKAIPFITLGPVQAHN